MSNLPEYARRVIDRFEGLKAIGDTGRQFSGCCPAHDDKKQSLGVAVADDRMLVNCYAGCDTKAVLAKVDLELKDLFPQKSKRENERGVTVNRLAFEKRLSADRLRSVCRLADTSDRKVEVPYLDAAGAEMFRRVRSALKAKDGTYYKTRGTKPRAYGLWLRERFLKDGKFVVLVEGESDCWALWSHDIPAFGLPGATSQKALAAEDLAGFETVYVWREPDAAGAEFAAATARRVRELGFTGKVLVAAKEGVKDPADLRARDPEEFTSAWSAVMAMAVLAGGDSSVSATGLSQTVKRVEDRLRKTGVCGWGEFEFTEEGNAGRLERLHGCDLRYIPDWGQWLVWDGCRWREDTTLEVYRRASMTVHSLAIEAQSAPGQSGVQDAAKWWAKSQSAKVIENTIKLSRSAGRIPAAVGSLDTDPMLLNCANGTVDLRTGKLRPHKREDMLSSLCPTAFDPDAECPNFERFLGAVFSTNHLDPAAGPNRPMIEFMQRFLGYCLTGKVMTNLLPIFYGHGSNGKSTLLGLYQDVVGKNYTMQAPNGFLMAKHGENHPTELADLFGKRFVVTSEPNKNCRLDEGLVKQLTGGDKIRARRMRENFWEFHPTHKIILSSNHKPIVVGNDQGIWRRLLMVPFLARFWDPDDPKDTGGPAHLRQDKSLGDRLRAESSGILAWLVRGCLDWQANGLGRPPEVVDATAEYRKEQDVLGRYLEENTIAASNGRTVLKHLYANFCEWCEQNGERPISVRNLATELRGRGFEVKNGTQNKTCVIGLATTTFQSAEDTPY